MATTADSSALRFAHCVLSRDGSTSISELRLDPAIAELVKQPISSHSFHREFELIAKYGDLLEDKQKSEKQGTSEKRQEAVPAQANQHATPTTSSKAETNNPFDLLDLDLGPAPAEAVQMPLPVQRERSLDDKEYTVLEMMERTGEDRDVCYFYLESMGWELDAAVELLKSMIVK